MTDQTPDNTADSFGATQDQSKHLSKQVVGLLGRLRITPQGAEIPKISHTASALGVNWIAVGRSQAPDLDKDTLGMTDGKTVIIPAFNFLKIANDETMSLMSDDIHHAAQSNLDGVEATGLKLKIVSTQDMSTYLEQQLSKRYTTQQWQDLLGYDEARGQRFGVLEVKQALTDKSTSADIAMGSFSEGVNEAVVALNTVKAQDKPVETFTGPTPGGYDYYKQSLATAFVNILATAVEYIGTPMQQNIKNSPEEYKAEFKQKDAYCKWLCESPNFNKGDIKMLIDVVSNAAFLGNNNLLEADRLSSIVAGPPRTKLASEGMATETRPAARTLTPDIEHSPHYKGPKP